MLLITHQSNRVYPTKLGSFVDPLRVLFTYFLVSELRTEQKLAFGNAKWFFVVPSMQNLDFRLRGRRVDVVKL